MLCVQGGRKQCPANNMYIYIYIYIYTHITYIYIDIDRSSIDVNTCQNIVLLLMTVLGLFSAMFAMARQQGFALQFAGERLQLDQEAWEVIVISPNSSLIIETSTRKTMENLGEYR